MTDPIRNYKLTLRGKSQGSSTTESEGESRPLLSSTSTTSSSSTPSPSNSCRYQSTNVFNRNDDSETETDLEKSSRLLESHTIRQQQHITEIPSILLQKKQNRRHLYPSSYETPELDVFEDIWATSTEFGGEDRNCDNKTLLLAKSGLGFNNDEELMTEMPSNTNHSLITIFAVWNTTMGSSLLAMSWGIEKTGLIPAIFINLLISAVCLYTANTFLKIKEKHGIPGMDGGGEVCDLCKALIGKWAEILAKVFSVVVLVGANLVYWVLMSNFLYKLVVFMHNAVFEMHYENGSTSFSTVICPKNDNNNQTAGSDDEKGTAFFDRYWDLYSTVPVALAFLIFPMLNWKSATFFTKFNSLGTFSVLYLLLFVAVKAGFWGWNLSDWRLEFQLKPSFTALSGMLSLSYFIHNIVITLMKNNRHQQHNGRDLTVAFGLITFTYLFIGVVFYISFPLAKNCIEDNILNNFTEFDVLTIVARILLFFQLFTVFPLITYMLRTDILTNINTIFKNSRLGDFTYSRVIIINLLITLVCILVACFLPRIGTLIRYTGAISGLVYIFMLPSLLQIASLKKEGNLTPPKLFFLVSIIVFGFLNLVGQFFISDDV